MSSIYSASPMIMCHLKPTSSLQKDSVPVSVAFPGRVGFTLVDRGFALSVAREVSAELAKTTNRVLSKKKGLVNDPYALWRRYVDWLYQHKELGLFLDVSQVGFTDEFVSKMEPQFQVVFKAMEELKKGTIANPDEGRMFSNDVVSGKIKPPSSPEVRFTQVLSVGIRSSALGPQFVAEELALDNPPLKIRFIDNTDPGGIDHQIVQLGPELASTLIIVISNSGGTPETINGLLERPLPLSVSMEAMIADPAPTTVDEHGNHDCGSGQQSSTIPLKNPRENKEMEWEKQKQKAKEDKKKQT
ncbi:hypothetical protein TB2_022269 [Malus domestica]